MRPSLLRERRCAVASSSPYSLTFDSVVWNLPVAPQSLEVRLPARVTVTPTLAGAYVDHFGADVGALTLTATTGWGVGNRARIPNGRENARRLISLYNRYLETTRAAANPADIPMYFTDAWAGHVWQVVPDRNGLTWSQQSNRPLLRTYTLTLKIIADLTGGQMDGAAVTDGFTRPSASAYAAEASALLNTPTLLRDDRRYTVQSGDSLDSIAALFGADADSIRDANAIRFAGRLQTGVVLTIPGE